MSSVGKPQKKGVLLRQTAISRLRSHVAADGAVLIMSRSLRDRYKYGEGRIERDGVLERAGDIMKLMVAYGIGKYGRDVIVPDVPRIKIIEPILGETK